MPTITVNREKELTQPSTLHQSNRYHLFWILFQLFCLVTIAILFFLGYYFNDEHKLLIVPILVYLIINSIVYYKLYYKNTTMQNQILKQSK